MQKITPSFFILILLFAACKSTDLTTIKGKRENSSFYKRQYLKDYALCRCIYRGFKTDSLSKKDASFSGAVDISGIPPEVFIKIDSVARNAADSILPVQAPDYGGKRAIIFGCTQFYKSKKLNEFIKQLAKNSR